MPGTERQYGSTNPHRFSGIQRPYNDEYTKSLGSIEDTLERAKNRANKLWDILHEDGFVRALGAMTGLQAVQMAQAGLKAIYLSGWQVAADSNTSLETYPDQSLYPSNSAPELAERINNALNRGEQVSHQAGDYETDWRVPIIADGEAGFGGTRGVYELTKMMIKSGVAAVHFEDQLGSEKKCGHLGGKVLLPTRTAALNLVQARKAADHLGVPTLIIARTDANSATLLANDIDERDHRFIKRDHNGNPERVWEGYFQVKGGLDSAIARALEYAPYADMLWCETAKPDLAEAQTFADAIHEKFPGKLLAYNCSPSFNWRKNLSGEEIDEFQERLGEMGYKFQFITLAGFHSLNHAMFELASAYREEGMPAFVRLQEREFESEEQGFRATKHQGFVGAEYFDVVADPGELGESSTSALRGSTEEAQF